MSHVSFDTGFRSLSPVMERMAETGPGRPMKFPYTIGAKLLQHPWKMTWQKGRGFRYLIYSIGITYFIFRRIDKLGAWNFFV